jgi:2-succinyl-5-enolpyruvyl-6-hydroxy-3-cyclohexene-1-carboxylate synthase
MSDQAAFCSALVDEWVRGGVAHAVVAPGSRSTPLAVALAERAELQLHVVLDERSAGFVALGIGRATDRPAVLLCTSGTAAIGFHAAVVEAALSAVPLLVCTADRPPDLHGVGAPQAIPQVGVYGGSPAWAVDVDPVGWPPASWRSLGSRAVLEAAAGPVHLNLRFREPLLDDGADGPPPARPDGRPWHDRLELAGPGQLDGRGLDLPAHRRVLVVAGEGCDGGAASAVAAGRWPVLADPLSGWRVPGPATIAAFDAITRYAKGDDRLAPDLVLHLGRPPASKALAQWLDTLDAVHVLADPHGRWLDPARRVDAVVAARPADVLAAVDTAVPGAEEGWLDRWRAAEAAAQAAVTKVLADHPEVTEPGVARDLVRHLPDGAALVTSSSMPVREIEWFAAPRTGLEVHANRGANGIDGVTSTALGVALARRGRPTALHIGDLALLHDSSGLTGIAARPCSLAIVVVDNHGGGIFSFLPQAARLPRDRFEQLFGTPQDVDLHALAAAHNVPSTEVAAAAGLAPALGDAVAAGGLRMLIARTDRAETVALHAELAAAVGDALAARA